MNGDNHNPYIIPLSILIAGVLIAGSIMYAGDTRFSRTTAQVGAAGGTAENQAPADGGLTDTVRPVGANDHIFGNPSAPVKIVEFSDLECPYCSRFHESMQKAMDEFGKDGRIAWVYRHFPLESIHPYAREAAKSAECINELGGNAKFWDFVDMVFVRQTEGLSTALFTRLADDLEINRNAFSSCVSSTKYDDVINADIENALASGAQGTPYSVIIAADGSHMPVSGAVPYATLKSQIESALGK
jgi:protein-disulfide isomerase